jgi:hypothetical protein
MKEKIFDALEIAFATLIVAFLAFGLFVAIYAFVGVANAAPRCEQPLYLCGDGPSGNSTGASSGSGSSSGSSSGSGSGSSSSGGSSDKANAGRGNGSEGGPDRDPGKSGGKNKGGD